MGKIQVLDEHTANQIAAGEVVERPASIVKELIENSIDAGSTLIEVHIKEGGFTSISIKDNGCGMDAEDVEKAFLRHATSKIKASKDLTRIKSLGFRGEALPSIVAVSRLTIRTSPNNSGKGVEVYLDGGNVITKKQIAYIKGTEILVEDIFYNTPARFKYLKSLQTELGHIIDYVNRLSLAYPQIAFTLIHNERLIHRTTGNNQLLHVIAEIYGSSLAKSMLQFQKEDLDFKVSGFISKPDITRASKTHISVFVNGRYIKNYLITQGIIKGFQSLLMINRFPVAVLHINMDPSLVDINVHPAKLEARFSKEHELIKLVQTAVEEALTKESLIREPVKEKNRINYQMPKQAAMDLLLNPPLPKSSSMAKSVIAEAHNSVEESEVVYEAHNQRLPLLDPMVQFMGTYIIAQAEDGLYLIDQHAAHERIYYEKNLDLLNEEQVTSQELIVPITIDFTKAESDMLISRLEEFQSYGIEIESFGQQTFIIRAVPLWMPKGQEKSFIETMAQMVFKENSINGQALRNDLIASISCKNAIKANNFLTKNEMENLLEQLRKTNNPFSCPHGRPVIIHFSVKEIEKMFKRVI